MNGEAHPTFCARCTAIPQYPIPAFSLLTIEQSEHAIVFSTMLDFSCVIVTVASDEIRCTNQKH